MGAWIEIINQNNIWSLDNVAPYVGAWIEIIYKLKLPCAFQVAPYVGAWIEILFHLLITFTNTSHPMWVRGLKYYIFEV